MKNSATTSIFNPRFHGDWENRNLYSLATWINGLAFRDFQFSETGKPVIKIAELKNGISDQTNFTQQTFDAGYHITNGDMLFAWSGSPDTSIDVFWYRGQDGWLNQHIFKIEPNAECDRVFFYILLKYLKPLFIEIARNKQTTGLGHVTVKDLQAITVGLPPLPIQHRIADILGVLDDKIECNRRINQTLEAMARALYKHSFVDEESRELSEEWEDSTVGDLCEFAYGKGLKETNRTEGQYPVYGSAGIIGTHNEYLVKAPGIVIGRKGTIGKVNRARLPFFPIDTTYYIVPKAPEYSFDFLYLLLGRLELDKRNNDSAVPGLNRNDAYKLPVLKPPKVVLEKFNALVAPLFLQIDANENENQTLTRTRDYLLPKLLSGEVDVKAA